MQLTGSLSSVLPFSKIFDIIRVIAIFLFFKNYVAKIPYKEKPYNILVKVSNLCFCIYLIHDFFVWGIDYVGIQTVNFNPLISVPVLVLFEFLLSLILAYFISKLPVLSKYIS